MSSPLRSFGRRSRSTSAASRRSTAAGTTRSGSPTTWSASGPTRSGRRNSPTSRWRRPRRTAISTVWRWPAPWPCPRSGSASPPALSTRCAGTPCRSRSRPHARPPLAGPLHPGSGQWRAREHRAVRVEFARPVARFAEALAVIRLLWEHEGPVDFDGEFFRLRGARLDTEPFGGRCRRSGSGRTDRGCSISRALRRRMVARRHLVAGRLRGEVRRPCAPPPSGPVVIPTRSLPPDHHVFVGDDDELAEVVEAPLVKAYVMQIPRR